MIPQERIWAGELNRRALGDAAPTSGLDSIRFKLQELGLQAPQDDWPALLAEVKALDARKHGLVTDDAFRELVDAR